MSDTTPPASRRRWPLFALPALIVILAVGWSGFWFYASLKVDTTVDAWRAREAAAGRIFDCGKRSVAGFPFRFEIRCSAPKVALVAQTAGQAASHEVLNVKLSEILVIAQAWDPRKLIVEFKSPVAIDEDGRPVATVNWALGHASVFGLPEVPQRGSMEFSDLAVDRITPAGPAPLFRAKHTEVHGRIAENSTADRPAVEAVVRLTSSSVLGLHPVLEPLADADVRVLVSGLKNIDPKPWPVRFREIQQADGRIEVLQSRIVQGDVLSIAKGSFGITALGNLDGELQMTVAGIEKLVPALGLEQVLDQGVQQDTLDKYAPGVKARDVNNLLGALDRAIPGLSRVVRQNANAGLTAGLNALGKETTLEGKKARMFPLKVTEGTVYLGPFKVGQVPPLF